MGLLHLLAVVGLLSSTIAAPATESKLCSTPACKEIAAIFKNSINASVNPCEDFYQYSCGNWMAHHQIPEFKSRTGVTEELEDVQTVQMKKLLEDFDLKTDVKNSSASVAFSAYLYQKCLQLGSKPHSVGLKHLKDSIASILGPKGWSIGQQEKPTVASWYQAYTKVSALGSIDAVFTFNIEPDPKNVTANILQFEPAELGLGDKELADLNTNPELIKAYKTYIANTAQLLHGGKLNQTLLENDINEIVNFESVLAKLLMPMEDRHDPENVYKLTIDELAAKTKFDWLHKILLPIWKILDVKAHIDGKTQVLVADLEYYVNATELLSKTSTRVIENYFGWLVAADYSGLSSESFRELGFEFAQVSSGVTKRSERWRSCLGRVNGQLNWALSRLFVDHHFSLKEKQEAAILIDEVQHAFGQLIKSNGWLDQATKDATLSKLNHIRKNTAYPQWLTIDSELDKLYGLDNHHLVTELLSEENYILSYLRFSRVDIKNNYNELYRPVNVDKNWPMGPFIVNAAYVPEQNSITIPAGQLKAPFFDIHYPSAINYGNIGATVGHELSHSLDNEGRQFDEKGNLKIWWNDSAIEAFTNRSQCFVKQYSAIVEPNTKLHLNGENTLGENLADNGGLHEAFLAFKNHQKKLGLSARLADLPQYTPEQLFFISYGFSWCTLTRKEAIREQIKYDPHCPAPYRVTIPLSNSRDFAKAFNCPAGSAMNPKKKCLLW